MQHTTTYHDLFREIEKVAFPDHWDGQSYVWPKYHEMYDAAMDETRAEFLALPEDRRDHDEFATRLKAREEAFWKAEWEAYWRSRRPSKSYLTPIH